MAETGIIHAKAAKTRVGSRWSLGILLVCIGPIGTLLTGWPVPACALNFEGIQVTPSLAYTGEYDDNLFRTQTNPSTDFVNTVSPGIAVEARPAKHILTADFRADILRYVNNPDLDTVRYFANLSTIFNFNRLQLRLKENFARTDDFPSSQLLQRIPRTENYLSGGFDYDISRLWGIGFDFTWRNTYYLDHAFDSLSLNSYLPAVNLYYRLSPKTRVFAGFGLYEEIYPYDNIRNNSRYRPILGASGDLTERFSVTGTVGYEYISMHNSSESSTNQGNLLASLEATYRPMEPIRIGLLLKSGVETSDLEGNLFYTYYILALTCTYAFTSKILIIPAASFEVDRYRESSLNDGIFEKRLDYIYRAGIGIRYTIQKWIRLDVGYSFERRDSNFTGGSYNDNRVSFSIAFSI